MLTRFIAVIGIVIFATGLFSAAAEPAADDAAQKPAAAAETEPGQTDEDKTPRVPVEVARDRAVLMHDVYSSTLDMIHHRYFRADKAIIPARAMEDIFSDMQRQSGIEARWIAVNLPAMGVDHEPETDFEKQAAKKIAAGDSAVELVDRGYYRRAGAISLNGGCIHCHNGFFRTQSTAPKYAALVISIPVEAPAETAGN
jgi:hypothetical protein